MIFTYDKGVEDGEPLDICMRHRLQYVVPPARPLSLLVLLQKKDHGIIFNLSIDKTKFVKSFILLTTNCTE